MKKKNLLISDKNVLIFCLILLINFIMILVYNFLTPYMSDDLWYDLGVAKPLSELIQAQIEDHMTWSGRDVGHLLLKMVFCFPKWVFNVINSIFFAILSILIYLNVEGRKKNDSCLYAVILLLMWFSIVSFDQTILWVSGACNYLWTGTIILAFITIYRIEPLQKLDSDNGKSTIISVLCCVGMFVLGLLSGWGNENTSGGAIILVIYFLIEEQIRCRKTGKKLRLKPWALAGIIGSVIGLILMVTAPGNKVRMEERLEEEAQTGLLAILGRILKLNDAVIRNFGVLLCVIIILSVYLILKSRSIFDVRYVFVYTGVAIITSYVLILTSIPMDRALFGAGILLIIACAQVITYIPIDDIYLSTMKYSLIIIGVLFLVTDYLACGADLMRIIRELDARQQIVDEEKRAGNYDLELPMLTEEWNNRFTYIYHYNDISDEDSYGNQIYKVYYDLNSVRGIKSIE